MPLSERSPATLLGKKLIATHWGRRDVAAQRLSAAANPITRAAGAIRLTDPQPTWGRTLRTTGGIGIAPGPARRSSGGRMPTSDDNDGHYSRGGPRAWISRDACPNTGMDTER